MKSWDNEDSISVFVFHVRKVFVPVVTENKTGTFILGHPVDTYIKISQNGIFYFI